MLDIKFIRENPKAVEEALKKRFMTADVKGLLALDDDRRKLITEADALKARRNEASARIGQLIKQGEDVEGQKASVKEISQKIAEIDKKVGDLDLKLANILHAIPNIPESSTPVGKDDKSNKLIREWGEKKAFSFKPKNHIELAETLDIVDFSRAARVAGSNFALFKGLGARFERALINFMIDMHVSKHGYTEIWPPSLVNRQAMFGTGQLPKMEGDMYLLRDDDMFLIPTAEVPVTNMHAGEVLDAAELPIKYVAYTPCFRREAGSYGKDTRGLIRVHEFDKVEMVRFVLPEESYQAHEELLADAEDILKALNLPYRVMQLASGELSFAAAKCYDLEVFSPGADNYLEVSSCSNFEAFQARRADIKFKDASSGRRDYVHTLNASGVALARTVIALLENYQLEDGSIAIPKALKAYMGGAGKITPPK